MIDGEQRESAMPKRVSLPSMLPPGCAAPLASLVDTVLVRVGLPRCSADVVTTTPTRKSTLIAAKIAQPCRVLPTILPKV